MIDLNSIVVAGTVGVVGYLLKESIQTLIVKLIQTMAKIQLLESKITEIVSTMGDVQKLRGDVNFAFQKIKDLEKEINEQQRQ